MIIIKMSDSVQAETPRARKPRKASQWNSYIKEKCASHENKEQLKSLSERNKLIREWKEGYPEYKTRAK